MLKATVADVMTEEIVKIDQSVTINQAAHLLLRYQINGLVVVDKKGSDRLLGILTTTDLLILLDKALSQSLHREQMLEKIGKLPVKKIITTDVIKVQKAAKLSRIIGIMHKKNIHTIPVYDGDKLVGVVGRHDILNAAFYTEKKSKRKEQ
jgi:CBS domain-containing protein